MSQNESTERRDGDPAEHDENATAQSSAEASASAEANAGDRRADDAERADAESGDCENDGDNDHAPPESGDEAARLREAMLRMRADMDNREKRMEREMTKTRKFALEGLMRDLIPVLDSMDQALAASAANASGDAVREGLELTMKQALKVLDEHGLEVLDPVGQPFDPSWHEAVATQPAGDAPADSVLQVLQKGYRLNERLVRPARVIVAA